MAKKTSLFAEHQHLGAKIVDFSGWEMPLHYGSQLEEHLAVRQDAGMFDVSHMTIVDVQGREAAAFLRLLLANNIDRLHPAKALYSCMLNEQGGIIDDLIVYSLAPERYRLVVNAATREQDLEWIQTQAQPFDLRVQERSDQCLIAVQGPKARSAVHGLLGISDRHEAVAELLPFSALEFEDLFIARTGYTGEDGYELMLPADRAVALWRGLLAAGVRPAGLGARDTLRLEAGMALYGTDMDAGTLPMEVGLEWTVAWEPAARNFIGRPALEAARRDAGGLRHQIGLLLEGRGVLRSHQEVMVGGRPVGEITSGSFSPCLNRGIALARVKGEVKGTCEVMVRGKPLPVRVVKPPFVRFGKACYE